MVVFFDIDGTVIDEKTQSIPPSAVRAIERLTQNGHIAAVNTGRPYGHIDLRIHTMAFNAYVCACGMEVRCGAKRVHFAYPDWRKRRFAMSAVDKFGMQPIYEDSDKTVIMDSRRDHHPYIQKEIVCMKRKGCNVLDGAKLSDFSFQKFVTFDGENCQREAFLAEIQKEFDVIVREGSLLEMVMPGASKASGMQHLLDALGASREDTLAIGDSNNDLPMFRFARHTACMGGGSEELKSIAEFVTAPVMEDGLEKALSHFGLIG